MARIFSFCLAFSATIFLIGFEDIEGKYYSRDVNGNAPSNSVVNETEETITENDIVFKAYNKNNLDGILLSFDITECELKFILLQNVSTVFLTHGWLGSENGPFLIQIKDAYLKMFDMNVIIVGWSKISRNEYVLATYGVAEVGTTIGKMLIKLLNGSLVTLDHIHLIGHSLGAHVMGNAGGYVRDSGHGKVKRITGLDPAKPGYEGISEENAMLDSGDSQFVDVIHTNIGMFGYVNELGHADFYPNGGYLQPGCSSSTNIFCSHLKAFEYFKNSIKNETAFPSVKCDSILKYATNQCESQDVVFMGHPTPSSARGTFYLKTNN